MEMWCVHETLTILNCLAVSTGTLSQQPSAHLLFDTDALFGVNCEVTSAGANVVVSQLHYYFENHGIFVKHNHSKMYTGN